MPKLKMGKTTKHFSYNKSGREAYMKAKMKIKKSKKGKK